MYNRIDMSMGQQITQQNEYNQPNYNNYDSNLNININNNNNNLNNFNIHNNDSIIMIPPPPLPFQQQQHIQQGFLYDNNMYNNVTVASPSYLPQTKQLQPNNNNNNNNNNDK
eukprot:UN00607